MSPEQRLAWTRLKGRLKYARRMQRDSERGKADFRAKRCQIQKRYYRKKHGVHVELVF